jgi:phosphatidylserine/phosphatidylglycerophosphate/cardiolipin synthase-like enzyme
MKWFLIWSTIFLSSLSLAQKIEPLLNEPMGFLYNDPKYGFFLNNEKQRVYELISSAKSQLDLEIYEMKDKHLRELLLEALERHVRVRILKEENPVGDTCKELEDIKVGDDAECLEDKYFVLQFQSLGGVYKLFDNTLCKESGKHCFMHGKMLLLDNKRALMSTGNWNSSSLCSVTVKEEKCNRDYSYVTKNKNIVSTLNTIFEQDFAQKNYDLKSILEKGSKALTVSPYSKAPLLSLIDMATKSLWVNNQYLKDPELNKALIGAAARGVSVHILLADLEAFKNINENDKDEINKLYKPMIDANIELKFFTKNILVNEHPGYMHAKAIVVDEKIGWIGSVNGSTMSLDKNREFGVIFKDKRDVRDLLRVMKDDFAHEGAVGLESY